LFFAVIFILVSVSPFVYWKYFFENYYFIKTNFFESEDYAIINSQPPKSLVALQGGNSENYIDYSSVSGWSVFESNELKLFVVYNFYEKRTGWN